MDFVKYIINCFKVYYPKFLCKYQLLYEHQKIPICYICLFLIISCCLKVRLGNYEYFVTFFFSLF